VGQDRKDKSENMKEGKGKIYEEQNIEREEKEQEEREKETWI
jgi:hypothetical protein